MRIVMKLFGLMALLLVGRFALAQPLTIDITKGVEGSGIPITIAPFSGGAPENMASIISADLEINGKTQQVLFFSNPDSKTERSHMTIKASLDEGLTWPETYQIELNETGGFGYSCMSMVDVNTVGILYEGVKDIYFQKVSVGAFFRAAK